MPPDVEFLAQGAAAAADDDAAGTEDVRVFYQAAVQDIEDAAGADDGDVIELAGTHIPRLVHQNDSAGDDMLRHIAADRH